MGENRVASRHRYISAKFASRQNQDFGKLTIEKFPTLFPLLNNSVLYYSFIPCLATHSLHLMFNVAWLACIWEAVLRSVPYTP